MLISSILTSLVKVFILILPGILFRKKSFISVDQSDGINFIVVNMAWPCLVIDAMQIKFSTEIFHQTLYLFLICSIIFAVLIIASIPISRLIRLSKTKQYLSMFMLIFGNTGFIGLPVVKALYGTEALFFAAIIELVNDVLLFTIGMALIQLSAGTKLTLNVRQLISPGLIGVILGLTFFLTNVQFPDVIGAPIEFVGNLTTPLSMFIIGFQLGGLSIKELLSSWQIYVITACKLLIAPSVALIVVSFFTGEFTLMEKTLIISFAMPVASCAALFSQQYRGEQKMATQTVMLTTLLSIITIPVFAILVEII
ncbi:MAG: AEC family transporter [Eubacteriales bacterium]|nr:AEC family transporter [Eubacteriales bacterium]